MIELAQLLGTSYRNINQALVAILFLCLVRECLCIATSRLRLTAPWAAFCGCLVASFPAWTVLISSVMTIHLVCLTLGLFGVRLVHAPTRWKSLIGFPVAALALNYQSLLAFLPALSYLYNVTRPSSDGTSSLRYPGKRTVILFCLCVISFLVRETVVFRLHGLYANYNHIALTGVSQLIVAVFKAALRFGTFLAPFVFLSSAILLWYGLIVGNEEPHRFRIIEHKDELSTLAAILLLLFCAVFPYLLVGKFSYLWDDSGWDLRHAIPLCFATAFLTAFVLQHVAELIPKSHRMRVPLVLACAFALVGLNLFFLIQRSLERFHRQSFDATLRNTIAQQLHSVPPGLLQIVGDGIPKPGLPAYEANYLLYGSVRSARWWTHIGSELDRDFSVPGYIRSERKYQVQYIYDYDQFGADCRTVILISARGFETAGAFRDMLGKNNPRSINVRKTWTACGGEPWPKSAEGDPSGARIQ